MLPTSDHAAESVVEHMGPSMGTIISTPGGERERERELEEKAEGLESKSLFTALD